MTSSDRRWRRVRVERGIYLQPNGLYSVCVTIDRIAPLLPRTCVVIPPS